MTQPAEPQGISSDEAIRALGFDKPPPDPDVLQIPTVEVPPAPMPSAAPPVVYKGEAKPGTLAINPLQAQAETLNTMEAGKTVAGEEGRIGQQEGNELARTEHEAANEQIQHAKDYDEALKASMARHEANHAQLQDAYNSYKQAAGNLKDPTKQFWSEHKEGAKVLSAFAAFASGMGAGLLGQTGNPYLEHLNKMIDKNYQAHVDNIKDLYAKQVQAGKIADDDQTFQNFMQEAKLHAYDLASMHIKSELEAIKNGALGQNQRTLADKTILGLTQQETDRRAALGAAQAQAAAASGAAARAKQKEIADNFIKLRSESLTAGYSPEQANAHAAEGLEKAGYDRSLLAPIMQANGATYDRKTDRWVYPEGEKPAGGDGVVPAADPVTGKPLKPEEREKLNSLKVTLPDGTVRLANNIDDQKHVQQSVAAGQKVQAFRNALGGTDDGKGKKVPGFIDKLKNGTLTNADIEQWKGMRQAAIDSFKGATGAEGLTGKGMATMLGEEAFPEPPSKFTNAIPGAARSIGHLAGLEGAVKAIDMFQKENTDALQARLRPATGGASPTVAAEKKQVRFKPAGS